MFWQPEEIQQEIRNNIRKFYNKEMTDDECNLMFDRHFSIFGSIDELYDYLNEDEPITKEAILKSPNTFQLSNGEILFC